MTNTYTKEDRSIKPTSASVTPINKGTWTALANSPAITDATGTPGNIYYVSAPGGVDKPGGIGGAPGITHSSMFNFFTGDLIYFSGDINKWVKMTAG